MLTSLEFVATWLRARFNDDKGASLVEYALLLALIAVVCIAAIIILGNEADKTFKSIGTELQKTNNN